MSRPVGQIRSDLAKSILQIEPEGKILLMSGYSDEGIEFQGRNRFPFNALKSSEQTRTSSPASYRDNIQERQRPGVKIHRHAVLATERRD